MTPDQRVKLANELDELSRQADSLSRSLERSACSVRGGGHDTRLAESMRSADRISQTLSRLNNKG
jgi:hypothetical protein